MMNKVSVTNNPSKPSLFSRIMAGNIGPVVVVSMAIVAIWYASAVMLNAPFEREMQARGGNENPTISQMISGTLDQKRPVLPSPHQVIIEIYKTVFLKSITSKRSLVYHAGITLSSTMLGFLMGTIFGIALAVGVVHSRVLEKSMMPWVISSQTIPILAIAPMIIVVLNAIGISGLLPKAMISMYLSFFPITVGMVKGLRSPESMHLDLLKTYSANKLQTFWMLRFPSSMPYLFTSMKIAVAISLVGAIVGELPTGAIAGLGARLLSGSYYGQTVQIWSALIVAAILAGSLVALVGVADRIMLKKMGMVQ